MKKILIWSLSLLLAACNSYSSSYKEQSMTSSSNSILENLKFECKHEVHPPLSAETQQLYNYAYYHDLHHMWGEKRW